MADRPIIFSAPMVRALLDGRKTQTRRLLKPQPVWEPSTASTEGCVLGAGWSWGQCRRCHQETIALAAADTVSFRRGDRVYVRESHLIRRSIPCMPHEWDWQSLSGPVVHYLADGGELQHHGDRSTGRGIYHGPVEKGRPSIHMPRWASRLTLFVEEVRVQRLQDISEDDAVAEGIIEYEPTDEDPAEFSYVEGGDIWNNARSAYAALWDNLHTEPGTRWDDNPWIYALTFRVARGNIDQLAAQYG